MNFNSHRERDCHVAARRSRNNADWCLTNGAALWPGLAHNELYFRLMFSARLEISFQFVWFVEVIMTDLGVARLRPPRRWWAARRARPPPTGPPSARNKGFWREQKNGVLMLFLWQALIWCHQRNKAPALHTGRGQIEVTRAGSDSPPAKAVGGEAIGDLWTGKGAAPPSGE